MKIKKYRSSRIFTDYRLTNKLSNIIAIMTLDEIKSEIDSLCYRFNWDFDYQLKFTELDSEKWLKIIHLNGFIEFKILSD